MVTNYRRIHIPGATCFFTVNLADRHAALLVEHIGALRQAFRYTQTRHPFAIDAIVVLPDHLHAVWTLPANDTDYPTRWRLIKTMFSRAVTTPAFRRESHIKKGERNLWQRRYWEHAIRDDKDLHHHIDYVHYNPVKHGHVQRTSDWPYSSFHRYAKQGILPPDGRLR